MKTILAFAVISSFIAMGLAQSCASREGDLSICIARVATGGGDFCNTCANKLIRYYRDCARGVGVEAVQRRMYRYIINACKQHILS